MTDKNTVIELMQNLSDTLEKIGDIWNHEEENVEIIDIFEKEYPDLLMDFNAINFEFYCWCHDCIQDIKEKM